MVTGAVIVPITPDQIEGYHRALDIVARERCYLTLTRAPPPPETRALVLDAIAKGDPRHVALIGGEVVGWCDIIRHVVAARSHRGRPGMGVVPDHRGRGLGSRLIQATLDQARRAGFTRIELEVYVDNAPAIALYETVGFVREGTVRDVSCIDGRYRDAITMAIVERGNARAMSNGHGRD